MRTGQVCALWEVNKQAVPTPPVPATLCEGRMPISTRDHGHLGQYVIIFHRVM
jgi:hypothetical protein